MTSERKRFRSGSGGGGDGTRAQVIGCLTDTAGWAFQKDGSPRTAPETGRPCDAPPSGLEMRRGSAVPIDVMPELIEESHGRLRRNVSFVSRTGSSALGCRCTQLHARSLKRCGLATKSAARAPGHAFVVYFFAFPILQIRLWREPTRRCSAAIISTTFSLRLPEGFVRAARSGRSMRRAGSLRATIPSCAALYRPWRECNTSQAPRWDHMLDGLHGQEEALYLYLLFADTDPTGIPNGTPGSEALK